MKLVAVLLGAPAFWVADVIAGAAPAPVDPWGIVGELAPQVVLAGVFWLLWQKAEKKAETEAVRVAELQQKRFDDERERHHEEQERADRIVVALTRATEVLMQVENSLHKVFDQAREPSVDRQTTDLMLRRLELVLDQVRDVRGRDVE